MAFSKTLNRVENFGSENSIRKNTVKDKKDNKIRFGNVFSETFPEDTSTAEMSAPIGTSSFSVGSSVEMMSAVFQMKEPAFSEELDTSIDLDSLEELDRFAEENAAPNVMSMDDVFSAFGSDDDDMTGEIGLEEIV